MTQKSKVMTYGKVLVNYQDGHTNEATRIGFLIGDEVRFLEEKALSKPAQTWLKNDILKALGRKDPEETASVPEATLDQQV